MDSKLLVELTEAEEAVTKAERLLEADAGFEQLDAGFEQLIEALAQTRSCVERAGWLLLSRELHNCIGRQESVDEERIIDVIRRLFGSQPLEEGTE